MKAQRIRTIHSVTGAYLNCDDVQLWLTVEAEKQDELVNGDSRESASPGEVIRVIRDALDSLDD